MGEHIKTILLLIAFGQIELPFMYHLQKWAGVYIILLSIQTLPLYYIISVNFLTTQVLGSFVMKKKIYRSSPGTSQQAATNMAYQTAHGTCKTINRLDANQIRTFWMCPIKLTCRMEIPPAFWKCVWWYGVSVEIETGTLFLPYFDEIQQPQTKGEKPMMYEKHSLVMREDPSPYMGSWQVYEISGVWGAYPCQQQSQYRTIWA